MERKISRAELHSPASTPDPEPGPEVLERLKAAATFEYVTKSAEAVQDEAEDGDLDFRLFANTTATGSAGQKVRLRSPTPQTGEPGFVQPDRPRDYYFANGVDETRKKEYAAAALSGAQVQALSTAPWPGSFYLWKVLHISPASVNSAARIVPKSGSTMFRKLGAVDGVATKRKRPGKKARVKVRIRLAAAKEKAANSKVEGEARERAEREKRARKNREKKLKKRARDKVKKAGEKLEGHEDGDGSSNDGS